MLLDARQVVAQSATLYRKFVSVRLRQYTRTLQFVSFINGLEQSKIRQIGFSE